MHEKQQELDKVVKVARTRQERMQEMQDGTRQKRMPEKQQGTT